MSHEELSPSELAANHETWKHIHKVATYIYAGIQRLAAEALCHDQTKLRPPEVSTFAAYTPKLKEMDYGSAEYKDCLNQMNQALAHHYKSNAHHPEHHEDGYLGMDLLQIFAMLCDWKAAGERHQNGCIFWSIHLNQQRFGYSFEFRRLLENTAEQMWGGKATDRKYAACLTSWDPDQEEWAIAVKAIYSREDMERLHNSFDCFVPVQCDRWPDEQVRAEVANFLRKKLPPPRRSDG